MKARVYWESEPDFEDEYEIDTFGSQSTKDIESAIDQIVEIEFRRKLKYEIIEEPDFSLTGRPDEGDYLDESKWN